MALKLIAPPPGGLHRLGQHPNPFAFRDPRELDEHEPAPLRTGNRFDAPKGEYRSIYLASTPYGCYLEKLAAFRHDYTLKQRMRDALDGDDPDYPGPPDPEPDPAYDPPLFPDPPLVPPNLFANKAMGETQVDPTASFVNIEHEDTLQELAAAIGDHFARTYGVERIDRGTVFDRDRRVTRYLALAVFRAAHADRAIGIKYTSAHAGGVDTWMVWDTGHGALHTPTLTPVDLTNPDLKKAASVLGLDVPDVDLPPMPAGMPDSW